MTIADLTDAEWGSIEAILVALWQAETERGFEFGAAKVRAAVGRIVADRMGRTERAARTLALLNQHESHAHTPRANGGRI